MLKITNSSDIPDITYFRTNDVAPVLQGEHLTIRCGTGTRRSWGRPGANSVPVLVSLDLVAIHVGYFHKYGGGQFWRYYCHDGTAWSAVPWTKLTDKERSRVHAAFRAGKAPRYAKIPGKLRAEKCTPRMAIRTTYKIVQIADGRFFSVYDHETEYILGKRLTQKALDNHRGGYYSYLQLPRLLERFRNGTLFPEDHAPSSALLALLECEAYGTFIEYGLGKIASTYLRPVKVLQEFSFAVKH